MKSVANIVERIVERKENPLIDAGYELQESLPLFTGNVFSGSMHSRSSGLNSIVKSRVVSHIDSALKIGFETKPENRTASSSRQDHLACAKRLSRAMQQIPSNSRQHIQAGRLVCHHLVAMLHDSPAHNLRVSGKLSK